MARRCARHAAVLAALTGLLPAGAHAQVTGPATAYAPVAAPLPISRPVAGSDATPAGAAAPGTARPAAPRTGGDVSLADLARVRARLERQLERAAEAGLVRLAPSPAQGLEDSAPQGTSTQAPGGRQGADEPTGAPGTGEQGPGVRATAAQGTLATPPTASPAAPIPVGNPVAAAVDREALAVALDAPVCHGDAAFRLPYPADPIGRAGQAVTAEGPGNAAPVRDDAPAQRLLALHAPLADGSADPAAAEAFVRFALAHGLVPEALAALVEHAPRAPLTPLLAAMALALDGRPLPDGHALSAPGCGGLYALWRALAVAPDDAPAALAAIQAAGRSLQTAPPVLALAVAERVGLAATREGQWLTARRMEAMADRLRPPGGEPSDTALLLAAALADHEDGTGAALPALRRLWARSLRRGIAIEGPAAKALLRLADLVLAGSDALEARDTRDLRADLAAQAMLARGTPSGTRALVAEAELTAAALGREAGLDLLAMARRHGWLDPAAYPDAVRAVSAHGDGDVPLALAHARDPERFAGSLVQPALRRALARSYADIGLPARGEALLRAGDLADAGLTASLAEAYLATGAPEVAARLVARLPPGPERAALEVRAREALGDMAAALAAAGSRPARERARLAWAAGDWTAAAAALEEARAGSEGSRPGIDARLEVARLRAGLETPAPLPAAPEGIARVLDDIRAETERFQEILDDG